MVSSPRQERPSGDRNRFCLLKLWIKEILRKHNSRIMVWFRYILNKKNQLNPVNVFYTWFYTMLQNSNRFSEMTELMGY